MPIIVSYSNSVSPFESLISRAASESWKREFSLFCPGNEKGHFLSFCENANYTLFFIRTSYFGLRLVFFLFFVKNSLFTDSPSVIPNWIGSMSVKQKFEKLKSHQCSWKVVWVHSAHFYTTRQSDRQLFFSDHSIFFWVGSCIFLVRFHHQQLLLLSQVRFFWMELSEVENAAPALQNFPLLFGQMVSLPPLTKSSVWFCSHIL